MTKRIFCDKCNKKQASVQRGYTDENGCSRNAECVNPCPNCTAVDETTSDGYHTFAELYQHRTALLAALCFAKSDLAWKSRLHADGTMFDGDWFIVGLTLPTGAITYHCEGRYWDLFRFVPELERAPEWDGHSPDDVVERLNRWTGYSATCCP